MFFTSKWLDGVFMGACLILLMSLYLGKSRMIWGFFDWFSGSVVQERLCKSVCGKTSAQKISSCGRFMQIMRRSVKGRE